jgi:hypothetical protein
MYLSQLQKPQNELFEAFVNFHIEIFIIFL